MIRVAKQPKQLQLNNEKNMGAGIFESKGLTKFLVVLTYLCQMILLYDRFRFQDYISPALAVCTMVLMFTDYYYVPVAIGILTPNTMGTMFAGRISYIVVLIIALVFRVLINKGRISFNISDIVFLLLGLYNCVHLYFLNSDQQMNTRKIATMVVVMLWLIYIRSENRNNGEVVQKLLVAFAAAVTTNATISLITRTATKYEYSDRMGLIGMGANDPNIAAMAITMAIAIILSSQYIKVLAKVVSLMILFVLLITTVSLSGLLAVIGIFLLFIVFSNRNKLNITAVITLMIVAGLAIFVFPNLGIVGEKNTLGNSVNYLEYYKEKIAAHFESFINNDFDSATSGRLSILRINFEHFSEQSSLTQLFGGVPANPLGLGVSHNAYMDMILRFGYLGASAVILMIFYSTIKCLQKNYKERNYSLLLSKLLFMYWGLSLSVVDGPISVFWYALLLAF